MEVGSRGVGSCDIGTDESASPMRNLDSPCHRQEDGVRAPGDDRSQQFVLTHDSPRLIVFVGARTDERIPPREERILTPSSIFADEKRGWTGDTEVGEGRGDVVSTAGETVLPDDVLGSYPLRCSVRIGVRLLVDDYHPHESILLSEG